jgi:hypothetical protein
LQQNFQYKGPDLRSANSDGTIDRNHHKLKPAYFYLSQQNLVGFRYTQSPTHICSTNLQIQSYLVHINSHSRFIWTTAQDSPFPSHLLCQGAHHRHRPHYHVSEGGSDSSPARGKSLASRNGFALPTDRRNGHVWGKHVGVDNDGGGVRVGTRRRWWRRGGRARNVDILERGERAMGRRRQCRVQCRVHCPGAAAERDSH